MDRHFFERIETEARRAPRAARHPWELKKDARKVFEAKVDTIFNRTQNIVETYRKNHVVYRHIGRKSLGVFESMDHEIEDGKYSLYFSHVWHSEKEEYDANIRFRPADPMLPTLRLSNHTYRSLFPTRFPQRDSIAFDALRYTRPTYREAPVIETGSDIHFNPSVVKLAAQFLDNVALDLQKPAMNDTTAPRV